MLWTSYLLIAEPRSLASAYCIYLMDRLCSSSTCQRQRNRVNASSGPGSARTRKTCDMHAETECYLCLLTDGIINQCQEGVRIFYYSRLPEFRNDLPGSLAYGGSGRARMLSPLLKETYTSPRVLADQTNRKQLYV